MGTIRQHKVILAELEERFRADMDRLEAALVRLEAVAPHSDPPPDAAAIEAAERYIKQRTMELSGVGDPDAA